MPLDRSTHGDNKLLTMSAMSNYTLWRLKNQLVFPRLARKHHEAVFSNEIIGDTIDILKPFRTQIHSGRVIANNATYDALYDETVQIKINNRFHGRLKFNDEERTLEIRDFGDRYLQAVAEELANNYDEDGGEELGNALFYHRDGGDKYMDVDDVQHIRAYATEMSIPQNTRNYAILNPSDFAALAADIKPLNVPDEVKRSAIYEKFRGKLSDWYVFESVHVPYYQTGAMTANPQPTVKAASGYAGSQLPVEAFKGEAAANAILDGQLLTVAGVNQLMVRGKKRPTGRLMPFVCTANTAIAAAGTATIPIYPEINDGTLTVGGTAIPARKNVSNKAANGAAVGLTKVSTGSAVAAQAAQSYKQSVFYERDALEFVHVTLVPPQSAQRYGVSTDPDSGTSVQYLEDFDFEKMETKIRVDIMYGVKTVYPEIGLRYIGGKVV